MPKLTFQAGKVRYTQQFALSDLVEQFDLDPQNVITWLQNPNNKLLVDELSGALGYWAALDPPDTPVLIMPQWKPGDPDFKWRLQPGQVCAFPMQMPPGPYTASSTLTASSASDSPPALRIAKLSLIAGDLEGATSIGIQATCDAFITSAGPIRPSDLCYYNVRLEVGHPSSEGRFSAPTWPH